MTEGRQTKKDAVEMPALGMKLTDIYYVIFRQKWLIGAFLAAGLIAGLVVYFAQTTLYWSEAKLLVSSVDQTKSMDTGDGPRVRMQEMLGETALNSEMVMLTSLDLCEEVARLVGPDKILSRSGGSNLTSAAITIYNGLKVENPRATRNITVRFSHADPLICQHVLRQLIASYLEQHKKIHNKGEEFAEVFRIEATKSAGQIGLLEKELTTLNHNAGVISLDEDKKGKVEQLASLIRQHYQVDSDLAEFRSLAGTPVEPVPVSKDTNAPIPAEKLGEYRGVVRSLESARNREFELTATYTDDNPLIIIVRQQITEAEKKKKALEALFPKLTEVYVSPVPLAGNGQEGRFDPRRVQAAEARLMTITNQIAQVREELNTLEKQESAISGVKRKLELETQNYKRLMSEIAAIGRTEAIGGINSNIQTIQKPSAPAPNVSQRLKFVAGAFFGLLAAGLAVAFFVETFVDHTIRRPGEFESKVRLPLFLSIPKMGLNGHSKLLPFPAPKAEPEEGAEAGALKQTWAEDHPLRLYIDGLRDATLTHFGGDPHKPKLIGITSCGEKAGVTSIAAGLAGALSETGDGNVLLLNLNYEAEAAHPFYRGELACCLTDALELDKRANGKVLQNLYVATAGDPNDPATQSLPKQLARVVPKLRVCDYDYIVFDLPPTTPTTMTARLAGMMDLVILVVESEKDTHESVKQASKLLARSKAPVSAVLNKVRNPVPQWLHRGA